MWCTHFVIFFFFVKLVRVRGFTKSEIYLDKGPNIVKFSVFYVRLLVAICPLGVLRIFKKVKVLNSVGIFFRLRRDCWSKLRDSIFVRCGIANCQYWSHKNLIHFEFSGFYFRSIFVNMDDVIFMCVITFYWEYRFW